MSFGRTVIAAVAAALGASAAGAADLPTHKPASPVTTVRPLADEWSGLYFGLNGGYGRASSSNSYQVFSTTLQGFPDITAAVDGAGSQSMIEPGGLFGAQAGYLWEAASFYVLGIEGDAEWSNLTGGVNTVAPLPVFGGTFTSAQRLDVNWTSSLRARLGVAAMPGLLLYATGGAALAGIRYVSLFNDRFNEFETVSLRSAKPGWVVGAGLEYRFAGAWSARLEYLHSQYSPSNGASTVGLSDGTVAAVSHSSGIVRVDSVRLAINYFMN